MSADDVAGTHLLCTHEALTYPPHPESARHRQDKKYKYEYGEPELPPCLIDAFLKKKLRCYCDLFRIFVSMSPRITFHGIIL
jgi:hypothetical protein